jgi:hypothetical protein
MQDDPDQKLLITVELEVTVTDAVALRAAALASADSELVEYDPPEEREAVMEAVRSASDEAVIELVDGARLVDDIPGLTLEACTVGVDSVPMHTIEPQPPLPMTTDEKKTRQKILSFSDRVHGLDHLIDAVVATPEEMELVNNLRAMLWHASIRTVDELFLDAGRLEENADDDDPFENTWVLSGLPERYRKQYNGTFVRRFTLATSEVTQRLTNGWEPLPTLAHELALHLLLAELEGSAELWEIRLPERWKSWLVDGLLEDTDFLDLYSDAFEGLDSDPNDWFSPYRDEHYASPYVTG